MQRATKRGFTLIELLVVIAVIALLVGILLPNLTRAIALAKAARSQAVIGTLSSGCMQYRNDMGYYPLQRTTYSETAASVELLLALQGDGKYIELKEDDMVDIDSNPNDNVHVYVPGDGFGGDSKPILYYPSRIGNNGSDPADAFDPNDNDSLDDGTSLPTGKPSDLTKSNYLWNGSLGITYNYDSFLLIAPGIDRTYFNEDDVTNIPH